MCKGLEKISGIFTSINVFMRGFNLPVIVFFVSIFFYYSVRYGTTSTMVLLKEIDLAFITGSIFYLLTVSIPNYKQRRIAKNFAILRYNQFKVDIIEDIFQVLKKHHRPADHARIRANINKYELLREYYSKEDHYNLRQNCNKIFAKEVMHSFRQKKEVLVVLSSYDFVKSNDKLYERIFYLISWIDEIHHDFDIWYAEDEDYDFVKSFIGRLDSFIFGYHLIDGPKSQNDFVELIKRS